MTEKRSGNLLLIAIIAGILIGALFGGFWPAVGLALKFLGTLFLNALRMLVVPLVMTSMIVGVSRLGDIRRLGKIGGTTVLYYLSTTGIAVLIGIILVNIIGPGRTGSEAEQIAVRGGIVMEDASYIIDGKDIDVIGAEFTRPYDNRHMIMLLDQKDFRGTLEEASPGGNSLTVVEWTNAEGKAVAPTSVGSGIRIDLALAENVRGKERSMGAVLRNMLVGLIPTNLFKAMVETDLLPIILFSLIFGAILTTLPNGQTALKVVDGLNDAIMEFVRLVMLAAPVGIGALVAGRLADAGGFSGFWQELVMVGSYSATVLIGLFLHGFIVLPLALRFIAKRSIGDYSRGVSPALATAFATASSSATLPLSIDCVTDECGVSERTASFVLPLGATINMDGTALYEAVAALFIAQVYDVELGIGAMIIIFLTATLAAIGAAGIPQAGLVTMVIVLAAVGLPIEGISLILIVDWFLDRCRTTVNVWGDVVGAAVIERYVDTPPESPQAESPPPKPAKPSQRSKAKAKAKGKGKGKKS